MWQCVLDEVLFVTSLEDFLTLHSASIDFTFYKLSIFVTTEDLIYRYIVEEILTPQSCNAREPQYRFMST